MPVNSLAILVAIVGLIGLIGPFIVLTWMSLWNDEHTPQGLQDDT